VPVLILREEENGVSELGYCYTWGHKFSKNVRTISRV